MKIKQCSSCGTEGKLWQSVPKLCKTCAMKLKSESMESTKRTVKTNTEAKSYKKVYTSDFNTAPRKPSTELEDKTLPELIKLAQIVVNKAVKQRDRQDDMFICISCQEYLPITEAQAGHYRATTFAPTRFNLENIALQCKTCNCFKDGNEKEYRKNLVKKIGEERVLEIERISKQSWKWDRYDLIQIIKANKQ